MKVILLTNIKGFGQIGDIKNVSDGYGRNFLIPRKIAKLATTQAEKESVELKKKREVTAKVESEQTLALAEKVKDLTLEFIKKSSKTGRLFSSLTKEEIAGELSKALGAKIEPDTVDLGSHGEHIKQTGEHVIKLNLAPNACPEFKVVVK